MRPIHVVNSKNEKKIVDPDFVDALNESTKDKFTPDIQWYLDNGYKPIEDVIKKLESMK